MADPINIGKCVDFSSDDGINRQGWKIIDLTGPMLRFGGERGYKIQSNFGNGDEIWTIGAGAVRHIYECPAVGPVGPNNIEMNGGRKKRKGKGKGKSKSRKSRKMYKGTRKH